MGRMTGRDAVDGWIYLPEPAIRDGRGPERVATEDAPADWKPSPLIGFGTRPLDANDAEERKETRGNEDESDT